MINFMRTHIIKSIFFAVALAFSNSAFALEVKLEDYPYEYQDPFLATLTTAMVHGSPEVLGVRVENRSVEVIPGRDQVPFFENRGPLRYSFYPQADRRAPLIFVVAGLGGSANLGYTGFVAEILAKNGYQVLTVSSPFFWNFIVTASTTALPGLTNEDARDLYRAMKAELADVRARYRIAPRSYGAVGFSMGALELAYISRLDREEIAQGTGIGLSRILLVNPPVDLAYDAGLFDQYLVEGLRRYSSLQIENLKAWVFSFGISAFRSNPYAPGFFSDLATRLPLSRSKMKFLIGASFQETLSGVIYASQQVNDLGILKEKATTYRRSARLQEASGFLFQQYIGQFVLPEWSRRNKKPSPTIEDLKAHANFAPIAGEIASDERVYLMHNVDDPLLLPEHLDLLKQTFGPQRSTIYPLGGHVGNVWYKRNIDDMLGVFKPLD